MLTHRLVTAGPKRKKSCTVTNQNLFSILSIHLTLESLPARLRTSWGSLPAAYLLMWNVRISCHFFLCSKNNSHSSVNRFNKQLTSELKLWIWSMLQLSFFTDGPKHTFVSVTGETVEGQPVTLSCHSDANPAASYTWYQYGNKVFEGQTYHFPNIHKDDEGLYQCKSKNQHGSGSSYKDLNVQCKFLSALKCVSKYCSSGIFYDFCCVVLDWLSGIHTGLLVLYLSVATC